MNMTRCGASLEETKNSFFGGERGTIVFRKRGPVTVGPKNKTGLWHRMAQKGTNRHTFLCRHKLWIRGSWLREIRNSNEQFFFSFSGLCAFNVEISQGLPHLLQVPVFSLPHSWWYRLFCSRVTMRLHTNLISCSMMCVGNYKKISKLIATVQQQKCSKLGGRRSGKKQ